MESIFIKKFKKVHGNKYDYSKVEYINAKTKVCIICPIHGEFWQTPSDHIQGKGCRKCGYEKLASLTKIKLIDFIKRAKEIHGDKYDYSKVEYKNNKTKICIICPIHGEFLQNPYNHIIGQGCPKCGKNMSNSKQHRLGVHNFIKKAKEIHGDRYDYSKVNYVNAHTNVCIICPEHGEFWQKPNSHLNRCGCPICKKSKLEMVLKSALDKFNIKYITEKRFSKIKLKRSLPYDFYLPDYDLLIECQGEQHFIGDSFFKEGIENRINVDIYKHIKAKEYNHDIIYFTNKYFFKKVSDIYNSENTFTDIELLIKFILNK